MSQTADPIRLQYAQPASVWPMRVRRTLLGLMLAATCWTCWRFGPYAWNQSRVLYWQRQCMNFALPGDTVVYEEEPAAAAKLLSCPDYSPYVLKRGWGGVNPVIPVNAARLVPLCWRTLGTFTRFPTGLSLWRAGTGNANGAAIIFLHERVSYAGHRRLVCVSYAPDTPTFQPAFIAGYDYDTLAAAPATWTRTLAAAPRSYLIDVLSGYPRRPPLVRVYAGQPDQSDPAHFTVRYQIWGQEDVLDGRLLDNDDVQLTPRHSPDWPRN